MHDQNFKPKLSGYLKRLYSRMLLCLVIVQLPLQINAKKSVDNHVESLSRQGAPAWWRHSSNRSSDVLPSEQRHILVSSNIHSRMNSTSVSTSMPEIDAAMPPNYSKVSSGCCPETMIRRPGFSSHNCICVYPLKLELHIKNVTNSFANWSAVFQEELALQLGLQVLQVEIMSFRLNGTDLDVVLLIAPWTTLSFSIHQAETMRSDLDNFRVHLNSSLFGNYTLVSFHYFAPPPASIVGIPPLPHAQATSRGGIIWHKDGQIHTWIIVVAAASAVVIISSVLMLTFVICFKAHKLTFSFAGVMGRSCDGESYSCPSIPQATITRVFTLEELQQATNNFASENILGEGGFGKVFKGVLRDGTNVAIKKVGRGIHGDHREFVAEVELLSRLHHRNLVKLVGYHVNQDSSQHLLCYELIPNGSLEAWLHGTSAASQVLDWNTRMKIALDAARGLAYLHEDSQPCVIHRDFKTSNILLENDFHAKVADFGLAMQASENQINYADTRMMGTFGYVAPEYALTGHLLVKSDVYSYGVVLLELLSGRKSLDMSRPSDQENLVTWARPIVRDKQRLEELVDPKLVDQYPKEQFYLATAIAAACVAPEPSQRPSMGEVLQFLKMLQQR